MAALTSKGVFVCDICLCIATCDMRAENKRDFYSSLLHYCTPPIGRLAHAVSSSCTSALCLQRLQTPGPEYEIFTLV